MREILLKVIDGDNVKVLIERSDGLPLDGAGTISRILRGVYECTGIDFSDGAVTVEAVCGPAGSYCLRISKAPASKAEKADEDMYLFELDGPEHLFDAAALLDNTVRHSGSRLYKYRGKYFLSVYFPPGSVSDPRFPELLAKLSAYCRKCRWSILNEALLCEWADLVAKDPVNRINAALRK